MYPETTTDNVDGNRKSRWIFGRKSLPAASLILGLGALPLLTGAPAQAASAVCDVRAEKPVFANQWSPAGKKMINYPIHVNCPLPGVKVQLSQNRYEADSGLNGKDDHTGSSNYDVLFDVAGGKSIDSIHVLPNTENDDEEIIHTVSYRVWFGDIALTDWHTTGKSPETKFSK